MFSVPLLLSIKLHTSVYLVNMWNNELVSSTEGQSSSLKKKSGDLEIENAFFFFFFLGESYEDKFAPLLHL